MARRSVQVEEARAEARAEELKLQSLLEEAMAKEARVDDAAEAEEAAGKARFEGCARVDDAAEAGLTVPQS